uniref:non-specific serine/threonine protein kinase n=1 Tax=Oryza punctata TaxID=4537 RepID=A0A0E0M481_ORYPU
MNWISFNYLTTAILLLLPACVADDQLVPGKPLSVGSTAISNGGAFTLGFFSPTNSTSSSLYLGIWYNDISPLTVVWVANRETPVKNGHGGSSSAPSLTLSNTSDLVLADGDGRVLWTTNITIAASSPAVAVLMNTGNLVVRSPNGTTLWQSFDHPTDTYLPGMKIGINYRTRAGEHLLSWNGPGDPSPGSFSFGGDPDTFLQLFIWNQSRPYWRSAVWTGSPIPSQLMVNGSSLMYLSVVDANDEIYLSFGISDRAPRTRYVLTNSGKLQVLTWDGGASKWNKLGEVPSECERYGYCGPYGYCHYSEAAPTCECLDGFEPMSTEEWSNGQFSRGCRRMEELRCGSGGGEFLAMQGMQLPDKFLRVRNKTLHECEAECAGNCSCTAYAYTNLSSSSSEKRDATRCLVWIGELIDTQKRNAVKIAVPVLVSMLIITCICLSWFCIFSGKKGSVKKHKKAQVQAVLTATALQLEEASTTHDHEFPFVNFDDIVTATNNFSKSFMIGQGGFGKVYKGIVQGGQEVAVKRLSRDSDQGIVEFRNEVTLIAKLQHRNLVRLLGYCVEGHEKLLIYEYLPNKSLDAAIFKSGKDAVLDWPARFKIIKEMRPKIADFGMARIFGDNQQNANTRRVVGTYGYMAPEYAMEGIFSVKTDVYSFGVLLLEVISGLKISNIDRIMDFPNLIVYAWSLWMEGKAKDMVDLNITESCILGEALLCIHVGLLCVQENPDDRPLMSSVVSLLENGSTTLPTPNQPAYFAPRNNGLANQRRDNIFNSRNEMTLTGVIGGREVAIKRLSRCSEQGVVEFRNEVLLIAKLQHRNLVRLVGCSIEGDEKLLIYEFMANKILDASLFSLLYLHQDSRLTVIHRDLKASNILLDTEMNPKISDFGMARIFGDNQQNGVTRRVVGTYGYMAPEYAMGGIFSMKSDVYSFGVLLLEIVSGSRISSTDFIEDFPNLSIYAWNLWNEGKAKNMIDPSIVASCLDEVMLCIHAGLLCVQENLNDRPLMSSVMFILENGSNSLPAPNRPAYFAQRDIEMEQPRDDTQNSNNTVTQSWRDDRVLRGGQGQVSSSSMDWPASTCIAILLFVFLISWPSLCASDDRLAIGKTLSPGSTLVSDGGAFAMGFFSPSSNSTNTTSSGLYLGIWYNNIPKLTVVWVADQAAPIADHPSSPASTLAVASDGNLVLSDGATGRVLWRTNVTAGVNSSASGGGGAVAVLANSGNLVLRLSDGTALWETFDHPGNAFLPGMKIGVTYRTRGGVRLVSWKGATDPEVVRCGDGFVAVANLKLPDWYLHVGNRSYDECAAECRRNCSCVAYAYANLTGSSKRDSTRCLVWGGDLVDMEKVVGTWGDFEIIKKKYGENNKKRALRVLSISDELGQEIPAKDLEFPFVEYDKILVATDNFSEASLIGKGGFGKVYKGLLDGREVAVKRLSSWSEQGIVEFRNEVVLIAKLQHRNLVRLVGCSIEGDEKLLIYEYMPNKSLDASLFKGKRKSVLDWSTRFKIVKGVARGLLYLHQDSRLTIIHRDLKASNILLDAEMNPKISDFGMARIFGNNQQKEVTKRVVGTYGYMAPEYAMGGIFSMKSDVYSFGVLLLEIVSGSMISSIDLIEDSPNLPVYAWNLWSEGKAEIMIDSTITGNCLLDEVILCIHVALLCVQENLNDRPLMSDVVLILEKGSKSLPAPNRPAYFAQRNNNEVEQGRNGSQGAQNSNNTL